MNNSPLRFVASCDHPALPEKADRATWLRILKEIDANLRKVAEYALKNAEEDSMMADALLDARAASLRGRQKCKAIVAALRRTRSSGDGPLIPKEKLESLKSEYNSVFGDALRTVLLELKADNLLKELPETL